MLSESEFARRRRGMIENQIAARGVRDRRVIAAIQEIPREDFVPASLADSAYDDRALGVERGQTISQPYIVGLMTELLGIRPDDRVLEIGTGTGYQTAVLARLAGWVISIERIAELSTSAQARLARLAVNNVTFRIGDGSIGLAEQAPFPRIIVTAAAPAVIGPLVDQLAVGGRLVMPVGSESQQFLTTIERHQDRVVETPGIAVRFVKLIGSSAFTE